MNASNENHEPATVDELQDRLIDVALREVVGHEAPPDLSAQILAGAIRPAAATSKAPKARKRAFRVSLAIAAMVLIGTTVALLPALRQPRYVSLRERNAPSTKLSQAQNGESPSISISPYYMTDDVHDLPSAPTPTSQPGAGYGGMRQPSSIADGYAVTTNGRADEATVVKEPYYGAVVEKKLGAITERGEGIAVGFSNPSQQRTQSFVINGEFAGRPGPGLQAFTDEAQRRMAGNVPLLTEEGIGSALPGDQYARIFENPFIKAEGGNAVSTFSIDVDTASYANVRQFLMEMNTLPPPDAVRIEELINYFDYDYAGPPDAVDIADGPAAPGSAGGSSDNAASTADAAPFAAHVEVAACPWQGEHRLVRIGIKGREMDRSKRPRSNLVFLVDVSGSMDEPNKLPLIVYGLQQLTRELGENDRVAIVVYASSEGLVLPSTPGSKQSTILSALGQLQAGGSTAGGAGIQLAYQIAEDNFIEGGTNRVILCTDGDFNVGVTSTAELQRLCEEKAADTRVFLSVLGFGRGNLDDAMMEAISSRGNGNYHYVDNRPEARRVLVEELTGTLVTIAKDVKIQVEFNPSQVAGYRLIGYENRMLRTEDFNDDTKDAGEIGAGHTVTALYEIVPAGKPVDVSPADDLKYQQPAAETTAANDADEDKSNTSISGELLTLKMRYKQPESDTSRKLEWAITDEGKAFGQASTDFHFAAAVAGFGLLLRDSQHKGNLTCAAVLELVQSGLGSDEQGYRAEFIEMVRRAKSLRGE
jgi:secreted protein with Ig-like and vWFA domain